MPCNVLQPPSPPFPPAALGLSLFPPLFCPPLPAATTPLHSHPSDSLHRRSGVRSKFNFHRPTPLTYLPSATLFHLPPSFSTSPVTPTRPPRTVRETLGTRGKEATGCIPRDKLRGSIIHGNLQAPLFKRRPASPGSPGRHPDLAARRHKHADR